MTSEPFKRRSYILCLLVSIIRFFRKMNVYIFNPKKKIKLTKTFYLGKGADLYIPNFFISDEYVSIASNFTCQTDTLIGPHCLISSNVSFIGNDHDIMSSDSAFFSGRLAPAKIVLEGNNFIGYGSVLLGDITIGKGAIIGACSLVLNDVPPFAVVAGMPAKIVKYRQKENN